MDFDSFPSAPVRYAFDDDESDSETEVPIPNNPVSIEMGLTTPLTGDHCSLVIGLKGPGSLYVKASKIGTAGSITIKVEEKDKPTQTKEYPIYLLAPNAWGISFQDDIVADDKVYEVAKPILNLAGGLVQRVVILDGVPSAEYLHIGDRDDLSPPCLRVLQTSSTSPVDGLQSLEAPNMLKGLSAAFISLCEVKNISCYTLVTMQEYYLGKPIVTLETVEAYVSGLKKIGLDTVSYKTADLETLIKAEQTSSVNRLYL